MPVILDNGSEKMRQWLDPGRYEWSNELQSFLAPYPGELEVYPVSKDVGKVGNNSPSFIIPIDSKENKSNIANFFAKGAATAKKKKDDDDDDDKIIKIEESGTGESPAKAEGQPKIEVTENEGFVVEDTMKEEEPKIKREDVDGDVNVFAGVKREAEDELAGQGPPSKMLTRGRMRGVKTRRSERDRREAAGGRSAPRVTTPKVPPRRPSRLARRRLRSSSRIALNSIDS